MKSGLLVTSPVSDFKNIGDYVQSLAARQFTPSVDYYIEKESISRDLRSDVSIKAILNAWYMWHPENWPPNERIKPLLTSVHMSPLTAERMVEGEKINYLKEHGPVGCRDLETLSFLESKGVPAYFSGCLTLTLGKDYKSSSPRSGLVFVDPYFTPLRDKLKGKFVYYPKNLLRFVYYFLVNLTSAVTLSKNKFFHARLYLMKFYNAAMFIHAYKSMFSKEALLNATYISHIQPVANGESQESLLSRAEELVKTYARSSLVVTSRIHCALPCLAVDTPVLFVVNEKMNSKENLFNAPGRFAGLIDFFKVLNYSPSRLRSEDIDLNDIGIIDANTIITNKNVHSIYRDDLMAKCKSFMKE